MVALPAPGSEVDELPLGLSIRVMLRAAIAAAVAPVAAERNELLVRLTRAETEVRRWQRKAESLDLQNGRLRKRNAGLAAELEEARRAAKRQAAPFRRRKRKENPKRPGRPAGHPAANRPVPPEVDADLCVPLDACPDCGGPVAHKKDLAPQIVVDVEAPPSARRIVRRFLNQSGYCPRCRKRVQSRHPEQSSTARGAAGVQIGARLHALGAEFHYGIGVTVRKVSRIIQRLLGVIVSPATWSRGARRIARRLRPTHRSLVAAARESSIAHVDETGWYITWARRKPWLHVFSFPELGLTLFAIRLSRGRDVAIEILGLDYRGAVGLDGWAAYLKLAWKKQQCHAHLLRRCDDLLEIQERGAARFPLAVKRLLLEAGCAKKVMADLKGKDRPALVDQLRGQTRQLLAGQIDEPQNRRFAQHLRRHEGELLTFLEVDGLGATNNEGERETRPGVVCRKVSAGNRSVLAAHDHEIIASVSRTAERNDRCFPDLVADLLRSPDPHRILPVLRGRPMPPPVPELSGWKEDTPDEPSDEPVRPRRIRPRGRRLDRGARDEARAPPS